MERLEYKNSLNDSESGIEIEIAFPENSVLTFFTRNEYTDFSISL